MGLDMYLQGEVLINSDGERPHKSLGYWRKHPNLHGFIVNQFADGIDDCKPIELSAADIERIILAILKRQLPHTSGFFFGESDGTECANDLQTFFEALQWLVQPAPNQTRRIIYQASW